VVVYVDIVLVVPCGECHVVGAGVVEGVVGVLFV